MISFETFEYPITMDEILGKRDLFIEYEFTDEGLDYEVVAVSGNGDRETIDHLLSTKEHNVIFRLIAQNERKLEDESL